MPIFWNANHATTFSISFSIQESHEKNITYPCLWRSGNWGSAKLNVTGLSSYCQKVSDLGPVIFYSKCISHAFYLLKVLHSTSHCCSGYWIYALWKSFVLVLKDVLFFSAPGNSHVDFKSFQSYLLSNHRCNNYFYEALTSFIRCKLAVPHLNSLILSLGHLWETMPLMLA